MPVGKSLIIPYDAHALCHVPLVYFRVEGGLVLFLAQIWALEMTTFLGQSRRADLRRAGRTETICVASMGPPGAYCHFLRGFGRAGN
jgi:hypothetical protein